MTRDAGPECDEGISEAEQRIVAEWKRILLGADDCPPDVYYEDFLPDSISLNTQFDEIIERMGFE